MAVPRKKSPANALDIDGFHTALHRWYAQHGRTHLPWRTTRDPYAIYISEVMLQQTQVSTVLERFYFPFLERFPTLQALADAERKDVLKAWQGLGYYSRAVNLHKAAQVAAPALPPNVEALIALPGIGRNTAHAVGAFAFRLPMPVMEANVKRVLHRIFALTQASDETLWRHAFELLDAQEPFDYNQAMMDVGALVCTRRSPKCGECPAAIICRGKTAPESYPAPKAKKQTPVRERDIFVLRDAKGRYFAEPRTERFLGGMYKFVECEPSLPTLSFPRRRGSSETLDWIPACAGMTVVTVHPLGHVTQAYSHFTLEADVYLVQLNEAARSNSWYTLTELQRLPHSKAEEKIIGMLHTEKYHSEQSEESLLKL